MERRKEQLQVWLICLALALVTFGVYSRVLDNGFVNFDDYGYIKENFNVTNGITASGLVWAFTTDAQSNWHPLTWISHMLDCQLYGIQHPGGHHLTSLLLHIANAILLFLVLRRMTGALWPSALVAALFAWHPLHVESVVWASERKDVLSTLFWLLTMLSYTRYVEARKIGDQKAKIHFRWTMVLFALGLMSKPMLVTLPFVLLLLDYWPFKRVVNSRHQDSDASSVQPGLPWSKLVEEKLPLFVLSFISSVITFMVQNKAGAVMDIQKVNPAQRIGNSLLSYAGYLEKMLWPSRLAIFYPFPEIIHPLHVLGAFLLLAAISIAAIALRRSHPYFIVGWLWYLGTLVPVIGIVQVGSQAMADRYSYMTLTGIFIALAWGFAEFPSLSARSKGALGWAISVPILIACLAITWQLVPYWKNTITVFQRDKAMTRGNAVAYLSLGRAYDDRGDFADADAEYKEALKIRKLSPTILTGLSMHYSKLGDVSNAIASLHSAISMNPMYADAHYTLGNVLAGQKQYAEAAGEYEEAIRLVPNSPDALNNLGAMHVKLGKMDEAMDDFKKALALKSDYPEAQDQLAGVFLKEGNLEKARVHYEEAARLLPASAHAQGQLGFVMARLGEIDEAIPHFERATNLEPTNPEPYFNLAAAYAAINHDGEAAKMFAEVVRLDPKDSTARFRLAWILATSSQANVRNGAEAVRLAAEANKLIGHDDLNALAALDAAYAETGQFDAAIKVAQHVQELAKARNLKEIADFAAQRIELYRAGRPYHR